jgi:serine/threonine protein kinase
MGGFFFSHRDAVIDCGSPAMNNTVTQHFTRAISLRGTERETALRELERSDPPTAQQVRAMIDAVESTAPKPRRADETIGPDSIGAPQAATNLATGSQFTSRPTIREEVGSMIGPYKILQEIGEGGFGFVYMAQQSVPIKRRVAIKIVKPGMDTRAVIGRFEAERQALAMMDHPNIAKVLDAGATPSGRPYFVMELVKGVPITEYCDTNSLTTEERLNLFIAVCQAVLHAHQKGIIHRDLKPSNIMVTLHDGEPVPKVIDFGIAKATAQDLTEKTVFTEYRNFIGTPAYMSPEQAAMSGLDVDTRSDVYSLGVVLYELLTGTTPLDATKLQSKGYAEIQRIIQEDEPPRPSTRVGETASTKTVTQNGKPASAEAIAKHRKTSASSLRKKLSGDLDWIVMKALEKDRTRRYASTGDFADDIRAYINDEPVSARPPSTTYKLRKFARRNRGALATGGAVLSALVLTLAALAYSYIQVSHERDITADRETTTRAEMLLSTMNSVRKYTTEHVRPTIEAAHGDPKILEKESVPAYSARQVFENFRSDPKYATFAYKEASLNPTNPANIADEFEAGILNRFRSGEVKGEIQDVKESPAGRVYFIARPMAIKDRKCLDCHTTPEMAPPRQVELYGKDHGFGWQMNEVVAAQMVYVPVSSAFRTDPTRSYWVVGCFAGAFLLMMVGLTLALKKA